MRASSSGGTSVVIIVVGLEILLLNGGGGLAYLTESRGPRFTLEPPPLVLFSNASGARVDCAAEGTPTPRVEWLLADGSPAPSVPSSRLALGNGTLLFPPFRGEAFRPDVHTTTYRCSAVNTAGRIISLDVQVRAVVLQHYEISVYDAHVILGNTAVLRCNIPSFVKDYMSVTSWLQDNNFNIYPSIEGDQKHLMLPSGDLYVLNASPSDGYRSYRCRTLHRLTGSTQESSTAGKIVVTEPKGPVPPRLNEKSSAVIGRRGQDAVIPCTAQGHPTPSYWWFRKMEGIFRLETVTENERRFLLGGSLVLRNVQAEDAGFYVCSANNSAGSASLEVQLRVLAPVGVHVQPPSLLVDSGQTAEFICVATGLPPPGIWWLKDGQRIRMGGDGSSATITGNGERIIIPSAQREDQGMYQCVAQSENDMAQSTAELRLGASKPQLLYKFIQQTLQPGPDVSLKCIATGQPTPQIQWTLDGFPLPQNERFMIGQYATVSGDVISHVNISKVSVEDGGNYACAAVNRVGITTHSAPLHVYGLPMVRKMPSISAVAGETLYVTCPAAGYPIAGITWEKDGRTLPVNHRQTVYPNGTLAVSNVQQKDDRGSYSCTVRNRQGHSDRGSVEITVTVPPEITPFHFQELTEGARVQVQCIVQRGDLPLNITWMKNYEPLVTDHNNHIHITDFNTYSSILTIGSVSLYHRGNYTCLARNPARMVSHTSQLKISVPPEWLTEPKDTSAIAGHPVGLHCQADGFPAPKTTWRKAPGKHPAHFAPINSRDGLVTVLNNGTLLIRSVLEEHEGYYLCEANNGIGAGLSAVVFLTVNALPRFVTPLRKETVRKGATASFLCEASGDQPMQIIWKRDGVRLTSESSHRYHIKESSLEASAFSQFLIRHVTAEDSGKYICIASNPFGKDETVVELMVQDVPEAPSDVRVMEVRSRSVKLSWIEPDEGNSPILQYSVIYTTDPGPVSEINSERQTYETVSSYASEWSKGPQQPSPKARSFAEVTGLHPSTTYFFRVAGVNQLGRGSLSSVVSATTDPEPPTGAPRSISVTPLGEHELRVTWMPPEEEHWNGQILGYYLGYMQASGTPESRFNYSTVKAVEGRGGEWILRGLKSFTKYKVTLQAFNSAGAGPSSDEVMAMTLEGVPTAAPQDVKCQALTSQSIQLVWQSPPLEHQNGIIKGFKVGYDSIDFNNGYSESEVKETSEHLTTIHGLQKYTNYSIRVAAFTSSGIGIYSEPIHCLTAEDVPGPPSGIRVALSAPYSAIVSWSPPVEANGLLLRYHLYEREVVRRGGGDPIRRNFLASQTQTTVAPLREHSSYEFWVTAATRIGEGPSTKVVSISANSRVPAAILSFGRVHALPWRTNALLPCQYVGNPRPELHWTHDLNPISFSQRTRLYDNGTLAIHEVQKQDYGNYTCHVKNVHNMEKVVHVLKVLVPPPAPKLEVFSVGSNNVTVQWGWGPGIGAADAAIDAGGPILGFVLSHKREHGDWKEERLGRRETRHTLTDLPCGTLHFLHISAFNRVGMGDASSVAAVHTRGEPPTAPPVTEALDANSHSITVHLEKWNDGDCPMKPFHVEKQAEGDPWGTAVGDASPGEQITLFGLDSGRMYNIRVTAKNNRGVTVSTYKIYTQPLREGSSTPVDLSLETRHEAERNLLAGTEAIEPKKKPEPSQPPFYADLRVSVPTGVSLLAVALTLTTVVICLRKKSTAPTTSVEEPPPNPHTDVKVQYYSALARDQMGVETPRPPGSPPQAQVSCAQGHIPEYGEDIYPYATFQVQKTNEQTSQRGFQTFVYQDARIMAGETMAGHEGACGMASQVESTQRVSHGRSRSLGKAGPNKGLRSDSEEYDSLGSDSDTEHATSSRTESSNQLDDNHRDKNSSFHSYLQGNIRHSHLLNVLESSTTMQPSSMKGRERKPKQSRLIKSSQKNTSPFVNNGSMSNTSKETAFTYPVERFGVNSNVIGKQRHENGFIQHPQQWVLQSTSLPLEKFHHGYEA